MKIPIVIIVGAPRSGTSILGRVLDCHPQVSTWVEPYYIWDRHFREASHDQRNEEDATDQVRVWIRRAFHHYSRTFNVDWVVDKSPRNCLKIPFVKTVFPEARYIFLIRDGRDTILSIKKQWKEKRKIFADGEKGDQWKNRIRIVRRYLGRRPLWSLRLQSLLFELGPPRYWLKKKLLNQLRWEGRFGWGPRFKGWQEIIDRATPLEFSAYQWFHCVQGILENISSIPKEKCFILKYEDFIADPNTWLENLFAFLDLEYPKGFMKMIPRIWADNFNKWQRSMSLKDLKTIGPIIGQTMIEIGYEKNESWY
ncbi:MAG: sulfotransferase [Deltaproteobacteria bacterium]|nr:sulfotransferase [Deltaproteobacteria bacterium]